jgi:hypothetical protein
MLTAEGPAVSSKRFRRALIQTAPSAVADEIEAHEMRVGEIRKRVEVTKARSNEETAQRGRDDAELACRVFKPDDHVLGSKDEANSSLKVIEKYQLRLANERAKADVAVGRIR